MKLSKAFTLAEVLIVVAIIGVVASLTIPNIIQNHRKHVVETRLKRFYVDINEAVVNAEMKYGSSKTWKITSAPTHFNYIKNFLDTKSVYTDTSTGIERIVAELKNGSAIVFYGNDISFYPIAKDVKKGKRHFQFAHYPNYYEFLKSSCPNSLYLDYYDTTVKPYLGMAFLCGTFGLENATTSYGAYIVWQNNWKIPKDYPFEY